MLRTAALVSMILAAAALGCARPMPAVQGARRELAPEVRRVVDSARQQTQVTTSYDPSYARIGYPGGDVAPSTGVCTDVVIRSFRAAGVDLQETVHRDMAKNFSSYPRRWGLKRPDTNIDHRRVPNLMVYFT